MRLPDKSGDHVLGLFRIVVGLLFLCHGAASLFGVPGGPHVGTAPGFGAWPSWWAAVIQLVGGGLVLLGVVARGAAFVCSGSMAYAYFVEHQPDGLLPIENGGEAAATFCWSFLLIVVLGPGKWTTGAFLNRALSRTGGPASPGAIPPHKGQRPLHDPESVLPPTAEGGQRQHCAGIPDEEHPPVRA